MASFAQFLQHSGVYPAQSFMIVPREGFNLVCLRDSKEVQLSYDRDRLKVEDVRFEHVERVAEEYINARYWQHRSQERADQLLRLRTALYAIAAQPDGLARALKVSEKGGRIPELKAMRGNTTIVRLDVAARRRTSSTSSSPATPGRSRAATARCRRSSCAARSTEEPPGCRISGSR
jgi:hypothetical protein